MYFIKNKITEKYMFSDGEQSDVKVFMNKDSVKQFRHNHKNNIDSYELFYDESKS